jgi:hypothetical protein
MARENRAMGREGGEVAQAWHATQARLPDGWSVDSLRCASSGLDAAGRSDDWVAVAVGPDGKERRSRASDPVEALQRLVNVVIES